MIQIGAGFQLSGTTDPNFSRDVVATKSALAAVGTNDYDEGHVVYCLEDQKHYWFDPQHTVVGSTTGYFKEFGSVEYSTLEGNYYAT